MLVWTCHKGHSWKMGSFEHQEHKFLLPAHICSFQRPLSQAIGTGSSHMFCLKLCQWEEQTKTFHLLSRKKSSHKNNSGFCQHSIWLLAAKRLFCSLDGWHIFLENALDDTLVRELLRKRIRERNTFHSFLELLHTYCIQPRKI